MIGGMFVEKIIDVLALSETKLKGKVEYEFTCVSGRVSSVNRGRPREGLAFLRSPEVKLRGRVEGSVIKSVVGENV